MTHTCIHTRVDTRTYTYITTTHSMVVLLTYLLTPSVSTAHYPFSPWMNCWYQFKTFDSYYLCYPYNTYIPFYPYSCSPYSFLSLRVTLLFPNLLALSTKVHTWANHISCRICRMRDNDNPEMQGKGGRGSTGRYLV